MWGVGESGCGRFMKWLNKIIFSQEYKNKKIYNYVKYNLINANLRGKAQFSVF